MGKINMMRDILLFFLFSYVCHSQVLTEHDLNFEGYNLKINSIANDGKGNLLIASTVLLRAVSRDSISKGERYNTAIIFITDEKLRIKKHWKMYNFSVDKAVYDTSQNVFWVGGSEKEYSPLRREQFGMWQLAVLCIDANAGTNLKYPIETDFSCNMEDLALKGNALLCTAIKDNNQMKDRTETLMVFEFSATKFDKSKYQPGYKTPILISSVTADTPVPSHNELTSGVFFKDGFYFGATASPSGYVKTEAMRLYQFRDGKLSSENFEPEIYNPYLFFLTNFAITKDKQYLFAYVTAPDKKFFVLEKTDIYFQTLWKIEVPDLQNADFANEVIQMDNGTIAAAGANKDKNWSFYIYDVNGALLKEIDTKMPISLHLSATQSFKENGFICSFSDFEKPMATKILWIKTE
jgi:hypothetical protein